MPERHNLRNIDDILSILATIDNTYYFETECHLSPGPILESKGMHAIFSKKGQKKEQKRAKKGKIFENWGKNVQNLKIF